MNPGPQQGQEPPINSRGEIDFLWDQELILIPDRRPGGPRSRYPNIDDWITPLLEDIKGIGTRQQEPRNPPEDEEVSEEEQEDIEAEKEELEEAISDLRKSLCAGLRVVLQYRAQDALRR
jgi:hypothetical protein